MPTINHGWWLSNALGLLYLLWLWKPARGIKLIISKFLILSVKMLKLKCHWGLKKDNNSWHNSNSNKA